MEIKKSPKADLEKKKVLFTEIGLVVTLCLLFVAFEWKTYDKLEIDDLERTSQIIDDEIVLNTDQNTPPPPPPPVVEVTPIELEIVDDKTVITKEVSIDAEANEKTTVETYVAPKVEEAVEVEEEIFVFVEENPSYPGGEAARLEYLQKNIKYPVVARENGTQGTVYLTFVVEKDGRVTDVKVLRGIGSGCDEEAERVVKAMPKWTPGKQRGKSVRVQYNMPIKFTLN